VGTMSELRYLLRSLAHFSLGPFGMSSATQIFDFKLWSYVVQVQVLHRTKNYISHDEKRRDDDQNQNGVRHLLVTTMNKDVKQSVNVVVYLVASSRNSIVLHAITNHNS